jgi:hypothetical protein
MMTMRTAILGAACALAAACGSGSDGDDTSGDDAGDDAPSDCTTDTYAATNEALGARCGADGGGGPATYCDPGDRCVDYDARECQIVASGRDGQACYAGIYDAFDGALGPRCGEGVYCLAGDRCIDGEAQDCQFVGSDGEAHGCPGPEYDAFNGATGARCGAVSDEGLYCFPGDRCVDAAAATCEFVRSPDDGTACPDEEYDAYAEADGVECGEVDGAGVYCLAGDTCASVADASCL